MNVYNAPVVRGLAGSTLVLGVRIDGVAKAYPLYLLRRPISDTVAGHRLRIEPDADALPPRFSSTQLAPGDTRLLVRLARLLSEHADLLARPVATTASRRSC